MDTIIALLWTDGNIRTLLEQPRSGSLPAEITPEIPVQVGNGHVFIPETPLAFRTVRMKQQLALPAPAAYGRVMDLEQCRHLGRRQHFQTVVTIPPPGLSREKGWFRTSA